MEAGRESTNKQMLFFKWTFGVIEGFQFPAFSILQLWTVLLSNMKVSYLPVEMKGFSLTSLCVSLDCRL